MAHYDVLPPPPWISCACCAQSVSDSAAVGGDCGPATVSSAPWDKPKSRNRKTWRRAGSGHAQEAADALTGALSSRESAHAVVQEGNELHVLESNQQPPPQATQQTRTIPGPCGNSSSSSRSGTSSRLEALPPPSPDAGCSAGCFGTPPQQGGGGEAAIGGGGLRNPRLSPTRRRGYSGGARSDASTATSAGPGGRKSSGSSGRKVVHDRRRIATTPVWKRPAVPLSKPYVAVPKKENGRL